MISVVLCLTKSYQKLIFWLNRIRTRHHHRHLPAPDFPIFVSTPHHSSP